MIFLSTFALFPLLGLAAHALAPHLEVDPDGDGSWFVFDLRYPGQQYDSATGFNYNYFRDYDPSVGRYVQSDPIGLAGGGNFYAYVGANPLRYADPLGLWSTEGHRAILNAALDKDFPNLGAVKAGSEGFDIFAQLPSDAHKHAQRSYFQTREEAKTMTCAFVKERMNRHKSYAGSNDPVSRDYSAQQALGDVYTTLFAAIPNETYTLEVASNGQTYRSTSQKMPAPQMFLKAKADLISKESLNASGNLVTDKFVNIHLTGNIATNFKSLYRIYGEYEFMEFNPPSTTLKTCYVPENIDNNTIKLLSAKDQRTDLVENFSLMDVPFDARFYRMYAFKIYQYAISGASLSYWKKINQISTTGQNLFDSPPGKIVGNIKNIGDPNDEVLGNFTLGAVSDTIIFTNMVKLGGVVTDICQVRFNTARPAVCLNCLLLPLSTTNRPDYWPQ